MDLFLSFIHNHESLVYLAVLVAIIIEGDISLLIFGALSKERVLNFSYVIPIAIIGALIHDFIFWKIGMRLKKIGKKKYMFVDFGKMDGFLERMRPAIGIYIVLSKFVWNFNRVILVSSGYLGLQAKKLFKLSLLSGFLWSLIFMSIGYVFADQTDIFKHRIETAGLFIGLAIVIMIVFENYLRKILKRYVFGNEINQSSLSDPNLEENKKN